MKKFQSFLSEKFRFLEVKFSTYLNRHVFVVGINSHLNRKVRKRTFGHMGPAKIQISLYIRAVRIESSPGAFWIDKDEKILHADNEDSDLTAQADLKLLWKHMSESTFSHVDAQFHENQFKMLCKSQS